MAWIDDTITTDRLRLRTFEDTDRSAVIALRTDPDVRRYLGGTVDDDSLARLREAVLGEHWGVFCLSDRFGGEALGICGFSRDRATLELSYELLPAYWGKGLAQEGCRAALAWAWANNPDSSIIAVTQAANTSSRRLLTRLGFVEEDTFVEWSAEQVQARLDRPD